MADPIPDDTQSKPLRAGAAAGMPRWVKVFIIIGLLVVALLVASQLLGGGHGPARHGGGETRTSTEDGAHVPPVRHGP